MQSPFYSSIKNPGQSKVYKINEQTHLLYYFVALEGIFSKFEINEEWVDYLIRNRTILLEWVECSWNCGKSSKARKKRFKKSE